MKRYSVHYQNLRESAKSQDSNTREAPFFDRKIYKMGIEQSHVEVAIIYAENPEEVYYIMNGQGGEKNPSPLENERGQKLVIESGVQHTSMSVNDALMCIETGEWLRVAGMGFKTMEWCENSEGI